MANKLWIFGDSYAESAESMGQKTTFDCWYERLEEEYNVVNFAISGTGPEWSLQRLIEEDAKIDGETLDRRNKKEISILFENILNDLMKLYVKEDGGFSYFIEKSQTHYYGVEITKGLNCADIHSTSLCIWAIIMILNLLEEIEPNMNIIKP